MFHFLFPRLALQNAMRQVGYRDWLHSRKVALVSDFFGVSHSVEFNTIFMCEFGRLKLKVLIGGR